MKIQGIIKGNTIELLDQILDKIPAVGIVVIAASCRTTKGKVNG